MRERGNVLFCGVGGQGILLASEITAYALIRAGFDIKKSEVHGMAQRGGSVEAHLRYGPRVYSPLIEPGAVDMEVAFELLESARYLPMLGRGSRVIVNTQRIMPPSVNRGEEAYPENLIEELRGRGLDVYPVDAHAAALDVGEPRSVNMVLVGALSTFLPAREEDFMEVIGERVKPAFVKANQEALRRGRALTGGAR